MSYSGYRRLTQRIAIENATNYNLRETVRKNVDIAVSNATHEGIGIVPEEHTRFVVEMPVEVVTKIHMWQEIRHRITEVVNYGV